MSQSLKGGSQMGGILIINYFVYDIWNRYMKSRGHGFKPRCPEFFFQASLRNCINCVHCDGHFFISWIILLTRVASVKAFTCQRLVLRFFHFKLSSTSTYQSNFIWSTGYDPTRMVLIFLQFIFQLVSFRLIEGVLLIGGPLNKGFTVHWKHFFGYPEYV